MATASTRWPDLFQLFEEERRGFRPEAMHLCRRGGQLDGYFLDSWIARWPSRLSQCPRSCSSCPSRAVLREPQTVGHVVEVPTILHFLKQTVDTPVPRSAVTGGQQGSSPGQSSSKRTAKQIADIPVSGGERHDFPPDPHPSVLPADLLGEPIQGFFFRTFPRIKKTPRAHDDDFYIEDEEHVWMKMDTGQWKLLGTNVIVGQPWP